MGNSNGNTVKKPNRNMPPIKRPPVPGPVNGYNYPAPYMPNPYARPIHPAVASENYLRNQFYPHPQIRNPVPEQYTPTYHHNQGDHSHHHHQHSSHGHPHHSSHGHHHHHPHHHHQPTPHPEIERLNTSVPPALSSSLQAQKPVSSVITYKVASPVVTKELVTRPSPVHQPASAIVKKSSSPILIEKPSSPVVFKQRIMTPTLLASSNSFEKAPVIETNYIAKSPDSHSINNYGSGTMSIVRRSSSQYSTSGNRWYDHDYDKRVKSLNVTNA